jgi:hypothetical protein
MRQATGKAAGNPFDVRTLWGVNAETLGPGGAVWQAWINAGIRMQTEASAFWNGRLGKDVAALTALGQCTTPAQALEAQMRYAREAMGDWHEEGQRMLRIAREAAAGAGMPVGGVRHARGTAVR